MARLYPELGEGGAVPQRLGGLPLALGGLGWLTWVRGLLPLG